jgi:phenylalanyl-tRNA synthetase beta chain
MNVSYDWLRAFVPFSQTPVELRDLLTAHTAPVEELVALREDLAPIVVARVVEEAPHPDSDHLHVTKVDAGTGVLLDVVCGASNVTAGKLYPFAMTGVTIPTGLKIVKRKIRGAISDGMLCSPDELKLGRDHDGIMELNIDVPPGTPFLQAVPVGDMKLVIDVGANRPDLLSHLGVAREIGAITGTPVSLPGIDGLAGDVPDAARDARTGRAGPVTVTITEPDLARRFMGVVIRGVKVAPSPEWLVERLASIGARSINNVVDASNYVLHELGQPTHAFDLAKLGGSAINVRLATQGERITTLDGHERALTPETIVIADATRPQAIAGIMGGRDSEVTDGTIDIFLEVANFNPQRVRTARKALALTTDASYRFERGVDVEIAPQALARVAQLIMTMAGGRIDGTPIDLGYAPAARTEISLRTRRVAQVLGDSVPETEITRLLSSVGFEVAPTTTADTASLSVPSWRGDVSGEVDLIEEVARLRGYDSFPDEIRPFRPGNVPDDPLWITSRRVREALVGAGLLETKPMPFVAGNDESHPRVTNPLAENEAHLRGEILDTLGRRAEYNLARMHGDVRIFEIGSVFEVRSKTLPHEELRVGVLVMGRRNPPHFDDPKSSDFTEWALFDEWDAKALGELVAASAYPGARVSLEPDPAASALWRIAVDGKARGSIRRLSLDAPVWAAPAFGVELSLGVIDSAEAAPRGKSAHRPAERVNRIVTRYRPIPSTPPAEFDVALLVPVTVSAADVEGVMRRAAGDLLEKLELFDLYTGEGVSADVRSLAWRLTFRHAERTLRDKEIEGRRAKILSALADELNVRQRT